MWDFFKLSVIMVNMTNTELESHYWGKTAIEKKKVLPLVILYRYINRHTVKTKCSTHRGLKAREWKWLMQVEI